MLIDDACQFLCDIEMLVSELVTCVSIFVSQCLECFLMCQQEAYKILVDGLSFHGRMLGNLG